MSAEIVDLTEYRLARRRGSAPRSSGLLGPERSRERRSGLDEWLSRHKHRWAEHRGDMRHVVDGTRVPSLRVNGTAAQLKNVSRNGIMAVASCSAAPGSRVLVTIAGCGPLSGLVIWNRDGQMGLEVPLGSMELARL